ncbi:MAG: hypothetical protein ABJ050_19650 [Paracoccaceae bacterium]
MTNRNMLEGVALCSPYAQGDLDNLCGLYAAINAICLVSAPIRPLRHSHIEVLMAVGVGYLQRRKWLSDALIRGMTLERQRDLTEHMAEEAGRTTGLKLSTVQLFPKKPKVAKDIVINVIGKSVENGSALVVCFENTLWHYTVLSGLSLDRIYLFDSVGLHWIKRRSFGICGMGVQARHCVPLASLIEVRVILT